MGRLEPGATYIYERANGVVYARKLGSLEREVIGWDADADPNGPQQKLLKDRAVWLDIITEAQTNPVLQEALDRAKIIYELSKKDNGQE